MEISIWYTGYTECWSVDHNRAVICRSARITASAVSSLWLISPEPKRRLSLRAKHASSLSLWLGICAVAARCGQFSKRPYERLSTGTTRERDAPHSTKPSFVSDSPEKLHLRQRNSLGIGLPSSYLDILPPLSRTGTLLFKAYPTNVCFCNSWHDAQWISRV